MKYIPSIILCSSLVFSHPSGAVSSYSEEQSELSDIEQNVSDFIKKQTESILGNIYCSGQKVRNDLSYSPKENKVSVCGKPLSPDSDYTPAYISTCKQKSADQVICTLEIPQHKTVKGCIQRDRKKISASQYTENLRIDVGERCNSLID